MILLIAVAYNGSADLEDLIASLVRQEFREWTLAVADNSSDSGEIHAIARAAAVDERVLYMPMGYNRGYFGAAREVQRRIAFSEYDWVLVVNTDLTLAPGVLATLAQLDNEGVGVVAPGIISGITGRDENPFMVLRPGHREMLRRRLMMFNRATAQLSLLVSMIKRRYFQSSRASGMSIGASIYAAHGSALVFSQQYFAVGGTLNHPLFLFGEEDYVAEECVRVGLPVVYRPDLKFYHRSHAQTGRLRSKRVLGYMVAAARYYNDVRRA